ncbi:MAG: DUF167 domain-containing protein [Euryarchaeota archaeon]|nr:DUF167 domain-containing protein [Euryarchaeota archaeon]
MGQTIDPAQTVLQVRARPGARKFQIEPDPRGGVVVHLTEPPEGGRANRELIRELERLFQAPVELASGATGRRKRVRIGRPESDVRSILASHR